jgi:hypothetical protein
MGIVEPMQRVEVSVLPDKMQQFEKIVRVIGKQMKQKEMCVVINWQSEAKGLRPFEDDDEGDLLATGGGPNRGW